MAASLRTELRGGLLGFCTLYRGFRAYRVLGGSPLNDKGLGFRDP